MKVFVFILIVYNWSKVFGEEMPCCPEGSLYSLNQKLCFDIASNSSVQIIPECQTFISHVNNTFNITFYLIPSGIIIRYQGNIIMKDLREYCVTTTVDYKSALVICDDIDDIPELDERFSEVLYIISGILFAVTALIYYVLPELRDLHGKIISTLCGTSSIGWILMASLHKLPSNIHLCVASGFAVYFFSMSSFYWMNILAIQVFRSVSSPNRDGDKEGDYKYYSLYGWGCSVISLMIAMIANYAPANNYIPGFGTNTCWFNNIEALWIYFYGPATILIITNCVLFSLTILKVWKSNTPPSQRYRTLAYRLWMSARLFVVLGLMWMLIIINSALDYNPVFGIIVNIYHTCHGIIVFILLVLRKRVIATLASRGIRLIPVDCFLVDDDEEAFIEETATDGDMTVEVPLDN